MAAQPNNAPTTDSASTESPYGPLPAYSASERPTTRADRLAFQVWIIMFLLVIVFTLMNYLVSWLI
jgi:hypothetical protein